MLSWIRSNALQDDKGKLLSYNSESVQLRAVPAMAKLKLQCYDHGLDSSDFGATLGRRLPTTPQELACVDNPSFWLAPDEWLFVSTDKEIPAWSKELSHFLSNQRHIITDLSDSITVIELAGEHSMSLLAQGCSIDFNEGAFPAGKYVSSRLFQQSVLIQRISEKPIFRLYVDRSDALHLWRVLERQAILIKPLITENY